MSILRSKPAVWLASHWYLLVFAVVLMFLLVLHGTLPAVNAPSVIVQSSLMGRAECLMESPTILRLTCVRTGYPIGFRNLEGFPIVLAVALLNRYAAIPYVDCIQLLYSLFLLLGAISLMWWIWKVTGSVFAVVLSTLLFYGTVFLLAYPFLPDLYPGLLLFPFFVVSGLTILEQLQPALESRNVVRLALLVLAGLIILELAVFTSGYVYVITIATLAIWCLVCFIDSVRTAKRIGVRPLIVLVLFLLILFIPGGVYHSLVFQVGGARTALSLLRGQAVDLITMFVPTQASLLFAQLLHLGPAAWDGFAFYGNGQNSTPNFVGISAPLVGLTAVVLASLKKISHRRVIASLGLIWVVGFVMSLGPSLKVNDPRPISTIKPGQTIWEMPAEDATLALPTQAVFRLPVINGMRYTYRWQLMSRLALAALVGIFLAELAVRRKVLAALLCLIVLIENVPAQVVTAQNTPTWNRKWGEEFFSQVITPLRPYIEDKRVLLLPAANDYLVNMIAPFTHSYTYNLAFDKEIKRIRPLQPPLIRQAIRLYGRGELEASDVCRLFKKDLVDRVVLVYFRMDSGWPQSSQNLEANHQKAEGLGLSAAGGLLTHEEPYFLVVERDPQSGRCSAPQQQELPGG